MADTFSFYLAQADVARKQGELAKLPNVRESFERAEQVWRSLADKAQRVADARQMRDQAAATRAHAAQAEADVDCE